MPWNDSGTVLSTNESVEVENQDALRIAAFQPFLTFTDTNSGTQARVQSADGKLVFFPQSALNAGQPLVVINSLVATGQPTPSAVEIHAQDALTIVGFQPFLNLVDAAGGAFARTAIQTAGGGLVFHTPASLAGATPPMVIQGSHDITLSGTLSVAKDVLLTGGDCAEQFDLAVGADCDPGAVMVIGDDGALEACSVAYDTKVAGVVSGAGDLRPALILDNRETSAKRVPIALSGKVYCKVDAKYGAIKIGDLLVASETAGHAMKAADPTRVPGAVIGKALRPQSDGRGLIPILVALQ
jgi:hypothetical protein